MTRGCNGDLARHSCPKDAVSPCFTGTRRRTTSMCLTYKGRKTTVLKSGSYAYGPAKVPHKATCASTVPCVLFIAFESPLDAVPVAKPN